MKKLFTILFLFCSLMMWAQDTPPIGTNFKVISSPIFKYYTIDSTNWFNKGSVYGWSKLATWRDIHYIGDSLASLKKDKNDSIIKLGFTSRWRTQHMIDSLSALKTLVTYEIEVTTTGVSTYSVPFILRTNTQVFYNGIFLFSGRWWGSGTTSLVVGVDTNLKDKINIINQ